jgi:hypothetical protein
MYLSLEKFGDKLPYILFLLKEDILKEIKVLDLSKLEEKLLKIYNDDIIPENIKKIIKFN